MLQALLVTWRVDIATHDFRTTGRTSGTRLTIDVMSGDAGKTRALKLIRGAMNFVSKHKLARRLRKLIDSTWREKADECH